MAAPFSTSIELRHLRYFVSAAEHGSFRKAGWPLRSRNRPSAECADLEDEIGVSLFIRHSSGVNLTLAGQRFLNRTRPPLIKSERQPCKRLRSRCEVRPYWRLMPASAAGS